MTIYKWVCEYCGEEYDSEEEAIQCCDVLRQEDEDQERWKGLK